jgi:hypothetical protein
MTRIDAAEAIAKLINAEENYGARLWTSGNKVRLYLKLDGGRKGWIDNGFVDLAADGTVTVEAFRQAGTIHSLFREFLRNNTIDADLPVIVATAKPGVDEDGNDWNVRDYCGDERGY